MQFIPFLVLVFIFVIIAWLSLNLLIKYITNKMTIKSYLNKDTYLNEKTFTKYNFNEQSFQNFEVVKKKILINKQPFEFSIWSKKGVKQNKALTLMFDSDSLKYKAYKYICNDQNYDCYVIFDSLSTQNLANLAFDVNTYENIFNEIANNLTCSSFDLYVNATFAPLICQSFLNKNVNNVILENSCIDSNTYIQNFIEMKLPTISTWQQKIIFNLVVKKLCGRNKTNFSLENVSSKISKVHFALNNNTKLNNLEFENTYENFTEYVNQILFKIN